MTDRRLRGREVKDFLATLTCLGTASCRAMAELRAQPGLSERAIDAACVHFLGGDEDPAPALDQLMAMTPERLREAIIAVDSTARTVSYESELREFFENTQWFEPEERLASLAMECFSIGRADLFWTCLSARGDERGQSYAYLDRATEMMAPDEAAAVYRRAIANGMPEEYVGAFAGGDDSGESKVHLVKGALELGNPKVDEAFLVTATREFVPPIPSYVQDAMQRCRQRLVIRSAPAGGAIGPP